MLHCQSEWNFKQLIWNPERQFFLNYGLIMSCFDRMLTHSTLVLTCKKKRYQVAYYSSRIRKSLHMWAREVKQTAFNLSLKQKPKSNKTSAYSSSIKVFFNNWKSQMLCRFLKKLPHFCKTDIIDFTSDNLAVHFLLQKNLEQI